MTFFTDNRFITTRCAVNGYIYFLFIKVKLLFFGTLQNHIPARVYRAPRPNNSKTLKIDQKSDVFAIHTSFAHF